MKYASVTKSMIFFVILTLSMSFHMAMAADKMMDKGMTMEEEKMMMDKEETMMKEGEMMVEKGKMMIKEGEMMVEKGKMMMKESGMMKDTMN